MCEEFYKFFNEMTYDWSDFRFRPETIRNSIKKMKI